jgi:hypothetical protein
MYLAEYEYDGYEVSLGVGTCGIRVTGQKVNNNNGSFYLVVRCR